MPQNGRSCLGGTKYPRPRLLRTVDPARTVLARLAGRRPCSRRTHAACFLSPLQISQDDSEQPPAAFRYRVADKPAMPEGGHPGLAGTSKLRMEVLTMDCADSGRAQPRSARPRVRALGSGDPNRPPPALFVVRSHSGTSARLASPARSDAAPAGIYGNPGNNFPGRRMPDPGRPGRPGRPSCCYAAQWTRSTSEGRGTREWPG